MESQKIKLYYFPTSYYSLKVLLALYEKDVSFEEQIVSIATGEQNKDWYLAINKNGEVPCLEVDGKFIAESEDIIDAIDEKFTSGSKLVPDVDTKFGCDVRDFRKFLHDIPVDLITYGIICNRHLKHKDGVCSIPAAISRGTTEKNWSGEIKKLQKQREKSSQELQSAIDKKITKMSYRLATVMDENKVIKILEDLENAFDKIEEQLQKSKLEHDDGEDTWLFGSTFTAADITMATLFLRLKFVGLDSRYFSNTTRPVVNEYCARLMQRPSVAKMVAKFESAKLLLRNIVLKMYGMKALKVGLVLGLIGIGYIGFREYFKGTKIFQK